MIDLILTLDALSVICQFLAVYFSYRIYNYKRLTKWWLALVLGFLIQGTRRALTLYEDINLSEISNTILLDRMLMLVISSLILVGLWAMLKNFESFEFVEKKVKDKLKSHI